MRKPTITVEQPDGSYLEIDLPFKWCICSHCQGNGTSSAYLGAFCSDEWSQMDDDWKEDYIAGRCDRACDDCGGSGKVQVVDRKKLTQEQRVEWDAQCRADDEYDATVAAERRMGC